ncbi:MAG: capsule assembly Wzi family protein [Reichenbachiella sp.]
MNRIIHILILLLVSIVSQAQVFYLSDDQYDYYRIMEFMNPQIDQRINTYPSNIYAYQKDSITWNPLDIDYSISEYKKNKYFKILPIRLSTHFNSGYPFGMNDGALWQGKGFTTALYGGVTGKIGILEYTISPMVFRAQNQEFELAPSNGVANPYNYQFESNKIDYVQRFGDEPLTQIDLGQTEVRLVYKKITLGVSNQNVIWGPSNFNPIILGNSSSGIPHVDLGTHTPINTKIGDFEIKLYWGALTESKYYDNNAENNTRYWAAGSFGYQPSFIPGLYIGLNRSMYKKGEEFHTKDLFAMFTNYRVPDDAAVGTNDEYDQMASLTCRWTFPSLGFEAFFELAKNDFGGQVVGFEPEHGRAYTLGLTKYFEFKNQKVLRFTYERSLVDRSKSAAYRYYNVWYTHGIVKQGYTHKGQLIAAGIGPGSTTDVLQGQFIWPKNMLTVMGQRIRYNDDYFLFNIANYPQHDHEWNVSVRYSRVWGKLIFNGEIAGAGRVNMYYIEGNDKYNWQFRLAINKQF